MADPDPHQMTDSATPAQLETLNLIKGQNTLGKKQQYSTVSAAYAIQCDLNKTDAVLCLLCTV